MMQSLDFMDSLAAKAMASVADGLWQGVVLVALVGVLLSVFRFANATTRFVVWCGTLLVVVSLPLVAGRFAPETRLVTSLSLAPPSVSKAMEPGAERSGAEPGATRIAPVPVPRLPFGPPRRWALYLMGAWILGGLLMLARLASSTCHLRKLKRRSLPLPGQFQGRLDRWLEVCSPGRSAVVRASEDISLPMAVGFTQPVILLPIDLVEELTGAELDQIVLHELAHLRRRDDWTKLAQKLAEGVFFFHPAVVWIGRRLNVEREIACDDWVVSLTRREKPYAVCLTRLAERASAGAQPVLASGALMNGKSFTRRIEMLLDKERDATPRLSRAPLLAAFAVLTAAVIPFLWVSPVLAAFEQQAARDEFVALLTEELAARPPSAEPVKQAAAQPRFEQAQAEGEAALGQRLEEQRRRVEEARKAAETVREAAAAEAARREEAMKLQYREPLEPPILAPMLAGRGNEEPVIPEEELLALMVEIARNDADPEVRKAALRELAASRGEGGAEAMASLYEETEDKEIKKSILSYLAFNASPPAVDKLKAVARSDPDPELRLQAVRALGALARPSRGARSLLPALPPAPLPPLPPEPPKEPKR